jgi:hypothetical protein
MTSKQKPPTTAAPKKRPAAKTVKAAAAEKPVAHSTPAREKDHRPAKSAVAPGKKAAAAAAPAEPVVVAAPPPHPPAPVAHVEAAAPSKPAAAGNGSAKVAAATSAHKKAALGLEHRSQAVTEDRQSQLKLLIARGKEQGYLTYAQVNDHLPSEIVDPEQIEDIVNTINDMGIPVYEKAPDAESLLQTEPSQPADEEAIEEAAAALAALDAELGRTTDPVRMYMREMGTVELLTREGEIRIAKRIVPLDLRFHSEGLRAGEGRPVAPG